MPSANVDLVRSIYADWERGDFRSVAWADPQMELLRPDSLEGDVLTGLTSTAEGWRAWLSAWQDYHAEADEYRSLDDERVLVLGRMTGRGRSSGAIGEAETVNLFHIREGKVARLVLYSSRERAFAQLGLAPDAGAAGSPD
jgi:ketosteroid isomerase-like protein